MVRIDNVWDAEEWRAKEIARTDLTVAVVGLYENTAQAIIRPFRHPEFDALSSKFSKPDPVSDTHTPVAMWGDTSERTKSTSDFIVCGSSQLTLGLLSALSRSAYEEDQLREALHTYTENRLLAAIGDIEAALKSEAALAESADPELSRALEATQAMLDAELRDHRSVLARSPGRVTVHLISRDASVIRESFYRRSSRRRAFTAMTVDSHPLQINAIQSDPHVDRVEEAMERIVSSGSTTPVAIITDDATRQFGLLGTMVADLPHAPRAVLEHSEGIWSPLAGTHTGHLQYGINLGAPMGDPDEASRAIETLSDVRAIAELSHAEYLLKWVNVTTAAEAHEHRRGAENLWDNLDQFYRDENTRPVQHLLTQLRELHKKVHEQLDETKDADSEGTNTALLAPASAEETKALEMWSDHSVNNDNLTAFVTMIRARLGTADNPAHDEHWARGIFIALAKAEHTDWCKQRDESEPKWSRPTLADRGITKPSATPKPDPSTDPDPGIEAPETPVDETQADWQRRALAYGETVSAQDRADQILKTKLERERKSAEILTWEQLISEDAQMELLEQQLFSDIPEPTEAQRTAIKREVKTPSKAFEQVVTVLHHLDALGYLSVVLERPTS